MANNKEYVEVINDGNGDKYVYDGEARDRLADTYTKAETEQYVNERVGLEYDAENRCVVFPATSVATYDGPHRCISFPALTI